MRLLSKERDYYDSCQGRDPERVPVWKRQEQSRLVRLDNQAEMDALRPWGRMLLDERIYSTSRKIVGKGRQWNYLASPVILLACGRALGGVTPSPWEKPAPFWSSFPKKTEVVERPMWRSDTTLRGKKRFAAWKAAVSRVPVEPALHRALGSPLVLLRRIQVAPDSPAMHNHHGPSRHRYQRLLVVTDVNLDRIDLRLHTDPWDMWREIDRYLTNEMAIQEDPPPLSDVGKLEAHGFDKRTSFRGHLPGEDKKSKRRANRVRKRKKK